jgi:hypothetical protein
LTRSVPCRCCQHTWHTSCRTLRVARIQRGGSQRARVLFVGAFLGLSQGHEECEELSAEIVRARAGAGAASHGQSLGLLPSRDKEARGKENPSAQEALRTSRFQ